MSSYEVKDLREEYAEEAAELFTKNYKEELKKINWLPKKYEDPGHISTILSNIIGDSPV